MSPPFKRLHDGVPGANARNGSGLSTGLTERSSLSCIYGRCFEAGLNRRSAILEERNDDLLCQISVRGSSGRFADKGDAVERNRRLARCLLVVTDNTKGAIVVIRNALVVMGGSCECRDEKKQYEKNGKPFTPAHGCAFRMRHTVILAAEFVKMLNAVRMLAGAIRPARPKFPVTACRVNPWFQLPFQVNRS
jgi:hypothetical protein